MSRAVKAPARKRSFILVGILFLLVSVIVARLIPNARLEPDMALILTIYCALYMGGWSGMLLPLFAGGYVGSFSAFPLEFMVLYPVLYLGIRFVTSFFQLRFVGYPMLLALTLEFVVGSIYALGIYLNHSEVFSSEIVFKIILTQALLTSLFLPPVFFLFERFSRSPFLSFKRALQ